MPSNSVGGGDGVVIVGSGVGVGTGVGVAAVGGDAGGGGDVGEAGGGDAPSWRMASSRDGKARYTASYDG